MCNVAYRGFTSQGERKMAVISKIESAPVARVDDHGEFEAWASAATAQGRQGNPSPDETIEFLINGRVDRTAVTKSAGRTDPQTFIIPSGATGVVLGAQIEGNPNTYTSTKVVMPAGMTTSKTADHWKVDIIPDGTRRRISIGIFTQTNTGVEGIKVDIIPKRNGVPADNLLATNSKGVIDTFSIDEAEEAVSYTVSAPETSLKAEVFTVERRSRHPRPKRLTATERTAIQEEIREKRSVNPWRNLRTAIAKANELFRTRKG